MTNFSHQNTITELHGKLNKLNDYSANDNDIRVKEEIECTLQEISGQIQGNKFLQSNFKDEQIELQKYIETPNCLTEPLKRYLVSLLRERLKTLSIETYSDLAREGKHE